MAHEDWTLFVAEPTRRRLLLARRWGVMLITNVSNEQFNVYQSGAGFLVTRHTRDGEEVEKDDTGFFCGGQKASIADAWEAVASYLSDLLHVSGRCDLPCQRAVVFDTTPGRQSYHLASLDYRDGSVHETLNFDPTSGESLACPVPPAQINELEASRRYQADLIAKLLDASVYRMKFCPLMGEVLSEGREDPQHFEGAKLRYVIFVSWCARRAAMTQYQGDRDFLMLGRMVDALIQSQFEQLFEGDTEAFDVAVDAFAQFDGAMANEDKPGPVWWIGKAVASFIFGANFDGHVPDANNVPKWAKRFGLPPQVLTEIVRDGKRILGSG
jgi:hypothetical protein